MGKQTINLGSAPNAGDGDPIRTGGDKINDNFTELYDQDVVLAADIAQNAADIAALSGSDINDFIRCNQANANGTVGQTINFNSDLGTANYVLSIIDKNGIGIQWTSKATGSFVIDSLSSGTFEYIAIKYI